MLGDRTVELVKQADKAAKLTEDLVNHPPAALNVVNPLPAGFLRFPAFGRTAKAM